MTNPPDVIVQTLMPQTTPLSVDMVAEVKAYQEVELRTRVTGLVVQRTFHPGQQVKQGDLLFVIDPRALDEAVLDAQAKLAEAEAGLSKARQDVERYRPLLPDNAIPRQTYDQAVATEKQSSALVNARRASLAKCRIDRSFAEVRSPVSGTIGLQQVEVGGLASAGQSVLATVSTRNPIVAYFSVSETDYIKFARGRVAGDSIRELPVKLILADGSIYSQLGKIDFSDRALASDTGTLTMRAVFENEGGLLRPGMSARVRITYATAENTILVPQKSVTELLGKEFLTIIDKDNKAELRPIRTGVRVGEMWLIEEGVRPGERFVVEGLQRARAGVVVNPVIGNKLINSTND